MKKLLDEARKGEHEHCQTCSWNPKKVGPIAFGVSCEEHGINWSSHLHAKSIQIVQDPAGTTPGITGRLCFVHNSKNPSDKTAQHAFDLWKATVSFDNNAIQDPFLKNHYWTNSMLHGADKKKHKELRKPETLEKARKCCAQILLLQINLLKPKVILANGEYAVNSLYDIGYLSTNWANIKSKFTYGAYKEMKTLNPGEKVTTFCTYHTAITPINTHIARLYSAEMQSMLDDKLQRIKNYPKVSSFLNKYIPFEPEGRGMRVLLLHWIIIGNAIREASKL